MLSSGDVRTSVITDFSCSENRVITKVRTSPERGLVPRAATDRAAAVAVAVAVCDRKHLGHVKVRANPLQRQSHSTSARGPRLQSAMPPASAFLSAKVMASAFPSATAMASAFPTATARASAFPSATARASAMAMASAFPSAMAMASAFPSATARASAMASAFPLATGMAWAWAISMEAGKRRPRRAMQETHRRLGRRPCSRGACR